MLYEEFKERTNKEATIEMFEKYEAMYMAGNMDKDDFCKMVKAAVNAEIKEMHENDNRLVRVKIDSCSNGNSIYRLYVEVAPKTLKDTGYTGIGQACWMPQRFKIRKGTARLTRAENEEIRTMDCWRA